MDHPRPNLRYVDAKELDDTATKLRGLEVDSASGEKLGKLEGFIIDATSGRPYHVVVGSSGWFKHKHFLLPIGHVALPSAGSAGRGPHQGSRRAVSRVRQGRVQAAVGGRLEEAGQHDVLDVLPGRSGGARHG
jgi:sporulation protein YlmC with PRC-barrel domain